MKIVNFLGVIVAVAVFFSSCSNISSDPDNSAQVASDSLSVIGDTISDHVSDFSTALHHVTNDINQIALTGNADRDFAVFLKSHHQGAIDLAQAEMKNGKDDALKQMAQSISSTYKSEVAELENHVERLKNRPVLVTSRKAAKENGFNSIIEKHKAMMWDMSKMDTNMVADKQFVAVMIPHLQSAVYLAEGYIKYGKDAELLTLVKAIIPRKIKQIQELNGWMSKNN